jgi:hypothetical protein
MNNVACDVIKRMHPPSLPSAARSVAFHEGNFLFPDHGDYLTEGKNVEHVSLKNAIRSTIVENLRMPPDYGYIIRARKLARAITASGSAAIHTSTRHNLV